MKRLIPALLALLVLIGSASAERTVVTALASEINPDNLVSVAFDAKIKPAMTVCSTSQSLCRNAMTRMKSRR